MELFIMRRYGREGESNHVASQEDHLSSLLSKIEKRKKQREKIKLKESEKETPPPESVIQATELVDDKVEEKQAEKRKHTSEDSGSPALINTQNEKPENTEEPVPKKKKKKSKKLEDLCEFLELNEPQNDQQEENVTEKGKIDTPSEFTVIGTGTFSKKSKIKRVLPYWLAKPFVVSGSMKEFSKTIHDFPGLDKDLVKRLEENNVNYFFPVQSHVIPWLLEAHRKPMQYRPNDVCVSSPTGSGKTLAFVLPIIQALKSRVMRHIRALVVLPVQDLAIQVFDVFKEYCKGTDLKVIFLTGQRSFASEQKKLVKTSTIIGQYNAIDIVITTPGRLVDHIVSTPGFSLKYLRFLVIDEADRIVDHFQNEWLYHVEKHMYGEKSGKQTSLSVSALQESIPPPPQKLLFSATLTQDPEKLQRLGLFQPKLFSVIVGEKDEDVQDLASEIRGDFVGKYTTPAELTEKFCVVNPQFKPLILFHLMKKENWKNVLCFTNSQQNTHRLALLLKHLGGDMFKVGEISAALQRAVRNKMIQKFFSGKLNILVSSDALARGIDIPNVDYVVSYDSPMYVKTHIHRIGRTARAGRLGTAVTFLEEQQVRKFQTMLQTAGKKERIEEFSVSASDLEYLENDYKNALVSLQESLKGEEAYTAKRAIVFKNVQPKLKKASKIQSKRRNLKQRNKEKMS